jgi:hypothetical protein
VVFGQTWSVLDIVGEIIFPQKLNIKNEVNNRRILKLLLRLNINLKIYSPSFYEIYETITTKDQKFFFGSFLTTKFFTPKFMKIRCYLEIFMIFGCDFQIKLTIYNSSLSLRCVNMSELEFF